MCSSRTTTIAASGLERGKGEDHRRVVLMRLVLPVIDGHLVKRDIGDAAACLEAVQNIPESLFDKIDAVDAKGRHRARPAKATISGINSGPRWPNVKVPALTIAA